MRRRDFAGILVAMLADSVQLGTTVWTLGGDQLAIPVQLLFSLGVSGVLMLIMGPHKRLLPGAVLELVPFGNVLPGFTAAALWVALRGRR